MAKILTPTEARAKLANLAYWMNDWQNDHVEVLEIIQGQPLYVLEALIRDGYLSYGPNGYYVQGNAGYYRNPR